MQTVQWCLSSGRRPADERLILLFLTAFSVGARELGRKDGDCAVCFCSSSIEEQTVEISVWLVAVAVVA